MSNRDFILRRMTYSRGLCLFMLSLLMMPSAGLSQRIFSDSKQMEVIEVRFSDSDHPSYKAPDFDDSGWELKSHNYLPMRAGPYWLRMRVTLKEGPIIDGSPLGITLKLVASYEAFWDGIKLINSGKVGSDKSTEIPGPLDNVIYIPSALSDPGEHVIALRMSSYHGGFPTDSYSVVLHSGRYADLELAPVRAALSGYLFAILFLLIAVFFIAYYFTSGRRSLTRSFFLLCIATAAFNVTYVWRTYPGYTYDFHYANRTILFVASLMVCALVVRLLLDWFRFPHRLKVWSLLTLLQASTYFSSPYSHFKVYFLLAVTCPLLAGVYASARQGWQKGILISVITAFVPLTAPFWVSSNFPYFLLWPAGNVVAFVVAMYILIHGEKEGKLPTIIAIPVVLLAVLIFVFPGSIEQSINLIVSIAVFILFGGVLIDLRKTRQREVAARLNAARLEAEMLRKQLQPHFLFNTLTSITEWIEEDPPTSVRFIEALADEMRMLASLSKRSIISMRDELELCRYHLQIMSYRKNRKYALLTKGVHLDQTVPPALIHTLVENAVTHYRGDAASIEIRMEEHSAAEHRRIRISAPVGERFPSASPASEGSGLRYIRARLEEAFPGQWELSSSRVGDYWITQIDIPLRPGSGGMS